MRSWIELVKFEGHVGDMELWQAICHDNGHEIEGWALVGADDADFYESDPRELPDEDLVSGYRLPSYMPGHRPEHCS